MKGKHMSKTEGQEVREAFDGPKVEHDQLMSELEARIAEEYSRASDSSESAAKVAKFLEETGLNGQAVKWVKSILKKLPKKDGQVKAMDIIRSLELILPMAKNHVGGQGTAEMQLEPSDEPETTDVPEADEDDPDFADLPETSGDEKFDELVNRVTDGEPVDPIDFGGEDQE
jgi:hypothetical protein